MNSRSLISRIFSGVLSDLRQAARALRRSPGFLALASSAMALGLGATCAIVSMTDAVLVRPLPFRSPERLVQLHTTLPGAELERWSFSAPEYFDVSQETSSFESLAAFASGGAPVSGGIPPLRATATYATASLFPTLGVQAALGRTFNEDEDRPGGPAAFVISHDLWKSAFGGDPRVLGRSLLVDGSPRVIVGVMPDGFDFPSSGTQIWIPLGVDCASQAGATHHYLGAIARLREGVALEDASDELAALVSEAASDARGDHAFHPDKHGLVVEALHDAVVEPARMPLGLMTGAAGVLLLIACVTVAHLMLVRAEALAGEMAIRSALGARPWRLVRQFLAESLIVCSLGCIAGLALAAFALDGILALDPKGLPRATEIVLHPRVALLTVGVALMTALVFGLAPLVIVREKRLHSSIHAGSHRMTGSAARLRLRSGLVVAQVALAVVLLTGAGLMLRSLDRLLDSDPGFATRRALTFLIELPQPDYPDDAQAVQFWEELTRRLESMPGVEAATVQQGLPPSRSPAVRMLVIEPLPGGARDPVRATLDFWQYADGSTADAMGLSLSPRYPGGRMIGFSDTAATRSVVLINETLADKHFAGVDPIGRHVRMDMKRGSPRLEIAGVVRDVAQRGLGRPAGTEIYAPLAQSVTISGMSPRILHVVVKTSTDPLALVPGVRREVRTLDAQLAISELRPLQEVIDESVGGTRLLASVLGALALIAVVLAAIGVHGVMTASVARRSGEIGIRMALGAPSRTVLVQVMRHGVFVTCLGLLAGIAGALVATQLMRAALHGISPADPLTLVTVVAALAAVALVAAYLPAHRATRHDPLSALRAE